MNLLSTQARICFDACTSRPTFPYKRIYEVGGRKIVLTVNVLQYSEDLNVVYFADIISFSYLPYKFRTYPNSIASDHTSY